MHWRKAWARNWADVRYCSDTCRRKKVSHTDRALETMIMTLLAQRHGSICPSEVARKVDPENWRDHMESVRRAARRLVITGDVIITQGGSAVDPSTAKGPIRIERVR